MNNYKRCKLWINDVESSLGTTSENTITTFVPSVPTKSIGKIQIAIEISLPKNMSNYALIGFEYVPSEQNIDKTNITVCINKQSREFPNDTLAMKNDKVYFGISEEFGQSILDTVVETLNEMGGFSSGDIIFNIGSYSECGSSKSIFCKATKVILMLSQFDLLNMTESDIRNKLEEML